MRCLEAALRILNTHIHKLKIASIEEKPFFEVDLILGSRKVLNFWLELEGLSLFKKSKPISKHNRAPGREDDGLKESVRQVAGNVVSTFETRAFEHCK